MHIKMIDMTNIKYCFLSTRYLTDILEMLQGLWIFIAFVLFNPEILLKNLISGKQEVNPAETKPLVDDVDGANKQNVADVDA